MRGVKIACSSVPEEVHDLETGGNAGGLESSVLELSANNDESSLASDRSHSFTQAYRTPPQQPKEYPMLLAYQSLGVVFGGTSPVNVLSATNVTNLTEEDLMGTFSLIFWTFTILCLIKYTFIVLHANDHGEGGTFALYSYLSRHLNFQRCKFTSAANGQLSSDESSTVSYHRRSALSSMTKQFLERSAPAQSFLLFIALLATCMVIGDGVLTPATCALQGIQAVSSKITQGDDYQCIPKIILAFNVTQGKDLDVGLEWKNSQLLK